MTLEEDLSLKSKNVVVSAENVVYEVDGPLTKKKKKYNAPDFREILVTAMSHC
ncbi:MAG: hypothetical protein ABIE55_03505 [Candidatus Aenigmatarchaeota archaeon]